MHDTRQTAGDRHRPHVFVEMDLMPGSPPLAPRVYSPPPTPAGKSVVCALCRAPRADRIHIDGENAADAESSKWG